MVLAFDDYQYVSSAKSITQANRSKKVAAFEFDQRQDLTPRVPIDFNDLLRNRVYKRKVIIYSFWCFRAINRVLTGAIFR